MSSNCVFVKVSKKDGFVRENNWEGLGYIGSMSFMEYLEDVLGLPTLEKGDSVCFLYDDKKEYVDIKKNEDFETYVKVRLSKSNDFLFNKCNERINYRMSEERLSNMFDRFDKWSEDKSPEEIIWIKKLLEKLKTFVNEVDFKKENMIFSYHY